MTDQLTVYEPVNVPAQQATPYSILQLAIEKGASIDQLEKLMALQERHEANESRKAYVAAMAAFKKNPPNGQRVLIFNSSRDRPALTAANFNASGNEHRLTSIIRLNMFPF